MKKQILGIIAAATLAAFAYAGPAFAQGATGGGGDAGNTTGVETTRNDDGFNPGWLGLLGLAGLAGLRRPAPTVVHRDATVRP